MSSNSTQSRYEWRPFVPTAGHVEPRDRRQRDPLACAAHGGDQWTEFTQAAEQVQAIDVVESIAPRLPHPRGNANLRQRAKRFDELHFATARRVLILGARHKSNAKLPAAAGAAEE